MMEVLTIINGIFLALFGTGWILFFRQKRKSLNANVSAERSISLAEMGDRFEERVKKHFETVEKLESEMEAIRKKNAWLEKAVKVLLNSCQCKDTDDIQKIREKFNGSL